MENKKTIGQWLKWDFKTNGNLEIISKNGRELYLEDSEGHWSRFEYDSKGLEIYQEDSDGYWAKMEWDSEFNQSYFEDSKGRIIDKRTPETI